MQRWRSSYYSGTHNISTNYTPTYDVKTHHTQADNSVNHMPCYSTWGLLYLRRRQVRL